MRDTGQSVPIRLLFGAAGLAVIILVGSGQGMSQRTAAASENLNSIHGASAEFIIGVGDQGTIIHFENGGRHRMPSGTTNSLLDVYVAAPDFAVAAGIDIVLLWDGVRWTPVATTDDGTAHRGVWASTEKDVVLYGRRTNSFELVCPHLPAAHNQPFCRRFKSRFIGACGHSDDIRLVLANGDIHRVNNAVLDPEGRFAPLYEHRVMLELTAAWFPEPLCDSVRPLEVVAVNARRELWRFDGHGWLEISAPTAVAGAPGLSAEPWSVVRTSPARPGRGR